MSKESLIPEGETPATMFRKLTGSKEIVLTDEMIDVHWYILRQRGKMEFREKILEIREILSHISPRDRWEKIPVDTRRKVAATIFVLVASGVTSVVVTEALMPYFGVK